MFSREKLKKEYEDLKEKLLSFPLKLRHEYKVNGQKLLLQYSSHETPFVVSKFRPFTFKQHQKNE